MKKKFIFVLSVCCFLILSVFLVACDNEEKPLYKITFISTNYPSEDKVLYYEEGLPLEDLKAPNSHLGIATYSLSPDFSSSSITACDCINYVSSDATIYVRWSGAKVGYINCYYDGTVVAKTLAFYNNIIWKLPSETEGGIGTIQYDEQPRNSYSVYSTNSMGHYCQGYAFDGWYFDEDCTEKVTLPLKITEINSINFYSQKGEPYQYNLSIDYIYRPNLTDYIVTSDIKKVFYNTDLKSLLSSLPSSLSEYELIEDDPSSSFFRQITIDGEAISTKNNGWTGTKDLSVKIRIKPKYSGYFQVNSTINPDINGLLFPYESLETYYQERDDLADTIKTTKPYGSNVSVTYKLSDIEGIKFKNGSYVFKQGYKSSFYQLMPNLKKLDLSEMVYLEEIPEGFFYGAEHIEEVYAPSLTHLKKIGGGFLCYNNIKYFTFDFSTVEKIGLGFLDCAFSNQCDDVEIDLSKLKTIENGSYMQCGFLVNDVDIDITVKMGDYSYLRESTFTTKGDVQTHYYQTVTSECTANITIYSHDAVAVANQLSSMNNINVIQY